MEVPKKKKKIKNNNKSCRGNKKERKEGDDGIRQGDPPNIPSQLIEIIPKATTIEIPNVKGILDLPIKIRTQILSYLCYKDRGIVQLVCRKFRNEIRTRVGIESCVNEGTKQGLIFMRDVIVDSIVVGRFLNTMLTPLQIIGHPDTVRRLTFEESIPMSSLHSFLYRCNRVSKVIVSAVPLNAIPASLSRLSSTTTSDTIRLLDSLSKSPVNLQYLRELTLIISGQKSLCFIQKLKCLINGPHLEKFSLRIGGPKDRVASRAIHSRILIHLNEFKSLTHLYLATWPIQGDSKIPSSLTFLGFPKSSVLELSRSIQLRSITLTESSVTYSMWTVFLSMQTHLEIFQVMHLLDIKALKPLLELNYLTLRKIGIHVQLWRKEGRLCPLNLEIFRDCRVLEELMIDVACEGNNNNDEENNNEDPGIPNVVLFRELPSSLRVLCLRNCAFLTLDLLQLRPIHRRLQYLGLVCMADVGKYPGFGVTYRALLRLLRFPALEEILVTGIRGNERDKFLLRRLKIALGVGLRIIRTGIVIGPSELPDISRWTISNIDRPLPFHFSTNFGVSDN